MIEPGNRQPHRKPIRILNTIILAGFFAGALDAVAAVLVHFVKGGKDPLLIFKYIASAVFGKKAFSEDWIMVGWGILIHFIIAYLFTIFFFFLYRRWTALSKDTVITSVLYGIFVWVIMNLIVLRFTKLNMKPFVAHDVILSVSVLIIAIGLPITLLANKHYSKSGFI